MLKRMLASYQRGEEIYGGTDPSEPWYCVISGAARKYALLSYVNDGGQAVPPKRVGP
jgi:hypothetical protein